MTNYIQEIQKQLIERYNFKEDPLCPGVPMDVVDGDYPMVIDGKMDYVHVVDNRIQCCNF